MPSHAFFSSCINAHISIQPFSEKSRTPTVAKEFQIRLYDPAEASTTPRRPIWNSIATVGVWDFGENGCSKLLAHSAGNKRTQNRLGGTEVTEPPNYLLEIPKDVMRWQWARLAPAERASGTGAGGSVCQTRLPCAPILYLSSLVCWSVWSVINIQV